MPSMPVPLFIAPQITEVFFHFNEGFPCLSPAPSHKWHYYRHRIVNPVMIKLIKSPKYGIDINDILYFRQVRPFRSRKNVY